MFVFWRNVNPPWVKVESVSSDTKCWVKPPATRKKTYRYRGLKEKTVLESTEKKPITVEEFAHSTRDFYWYRRKVSEGTKGPIEYEFTKKRVTLSPYNANWLFFPF